jgi:hypothetical protein
MNRFFMWLVHLTEYAKARAAIISMSASTNTNAAETGEKKCER